MCYGSEICNSDIKQTTFAAIFETGQNISPTLSMSISHSDLDGKSVKKKQDRIVGSATLLIFSLSE